MKGPLVSHMSHTKILGWGILENTKGQKEGHSKWITYASQPIANMTLHDDDDELLKVELKDSGGHERSRHFDFF